MKKQINLVILKLRNYRKFPILIDNADVDIILIYNKISFCEKKNYKYFVGYKDDYYKINPLSIILPQINSYAKCYDDETKRIHFSIKDGELLNLYDKLKSRYGLN